MKKLLVFAVILLFVPFGLSAVSYSIQVEDSTAYVNASIELTSSEEVTYWNSTWSVPEKAEVISIEDSQGTIEDYTKNGERLNFLTNRGEPRTREVAEIRYETPADIDRWGEIKRFKIGLSGRYDRQTSVKIQVPEKILGISKKRGFEDSVRGNTATFQGEGPVNLRVSYTDREGEYKNYILEGKANLSASDNYYPVLASFTGVRPDFRKFAVIIMPEEEYEENIEKWSAGAYESPGLIFIRNASTEKDKLTGLMMHETMHGFNQEPLNWVETDVALFDEGTSKFLETYINEKIGVRQPELFGEEETWEAPCEDKEGRTCRYTLPPRSTPEALQEYYRKDGSFMETWSPSSSVDRTFGYAYAELLIREYMRIKGATGLREVYKKMKELEPADTPAEYVSNLKEALGTDLKPCNPLREREFQECLEESREYNPDVPGNVEIDGENQSIEFKPIEISKEAKAPEKVSEGGEYDIDTEKVQEANNFFQGFGNWIVKQFEKLINLFR